MIMRVLGAALSVATVIVALGLARLASGPVSLAFLGSYLRETLDAASPGYVWEFDKPILDWTNLRPELGITITRVQIREKSGNLVAQAPRLDLGLSLRGLLLGRIAPTSIELDGASVSLVRLLDGSFRLGLSAAPDDLKRTDPPDITRLLSRAFAALLEPPGQGGNMGAMEHLAIRDVYLLYRDLRLGTEWQASNAEFSFERSQHGITGQAAIGLQIEEQTWALSFAGDFDRASQTSEIDVSFSGVEPFRLAHEAAPLAQLANYRIPLSGRIGVHLAADGSLMGFSANVRTGPGEIAQPDLWPKPIEVDSIEVEAGYIFKDGMIRIGRVRLQQGPLVITAAGAAEYGVTSPAINLKGDISSASVEAVKKLWPIPLASRSRDWFLENMDTGNIETAHFDVHIPSGKIGNSPIEDEDLQLSLQFSGVTGHYLRPMPPITQGRGNAIITGRKLDLTLDEGLILDALHLGEGKFILANTHLPEKSGKVDLLLKGSMTKTLELIDFKPLGYPSRYGIEPAAIGGDAATRLQLELPVKNGMHMDEVQFQVASDVENFSMPDLLNGVALEQATIHAEINAKGMEVNGTGRFTDAPAELSWVENFTAKHGPSSTYTISMKADEHQLEALGFPTAGLIAGPVALQTEAWGRGTRISGGRVRADAKEAELIANALSWRKPRDQAATISFDFTLPSGGETGAILDKFTIKGKDTDIAGHLVFEPGGPPGFVRMDRLKLGAANDLSGEARRNRDGVYAIKVKGTRADLSLSISELRKSVASSDPADKKMAYTIEGHISQLLLRDGNVLNDVVALGSFDGRDFTRLDVDGNYGANRNVTLRLNPGPSGNRTLSLISLDAGKILYGLSLFDSGVNGDLEMTGEFNDGEPRGPLDDAPLQGEIRLRNMQVVNAPALTRILTLASLTGIRDVLTGSGLTFDRILIPYKTRNGVVTITNAYGSGSEIGLTLHGARNDTNSTVDMNGTVIPAYTLNTVFGKVPILGNVLLGGKNEGVFAINYSATGSSDNPDIFVNPLSALTPGFLRQIFNLGDVVAPGEETKPPDAKAAPAPVP
ncbi:MAG: DUF3971 domain-containing protein [Alphaproteobacteria bacterium]|nr:DUF3971 domain-containing protein [Alphaproteobacteria bacterium]